MSASLVGSEMCIRDRCWPVQLKPRMPQAMSNVLGWECSAARWIPSKAVSYTHLTLPTICSV
eukprot:4010159-Alexandrium_andersonii.AAC.1